jgi:nitrogen regulatory protein PII
VIRKAFWQTIEKEKQGNEWDVPDFWVERYRGSEYNIDLFAKCKIEVAVSDDQQEETVQAIRKAAYTGEIGDGKIFVLPLEDSMRIRTGERGNDSL